MFEEERAREIDKQKGFRFSDEEAVAEADRKLERAGYLAEVRRNRKNNEAEISSQFGDFIEKHPLDPEDEKAKIKELRDKCVVIDNAGKGVLAGEFQGGNFLFHGTRVEQAISILDSGGLVSRHTLIEREEESAEAEEREKSHVRNNSGYEGISWNFNEITAMPADRYHIVGFVTSPDTVLEGGHQLAIPSRPAPNELILINEEIDGKKYYEAKTQSELMSAWGLGESNSVLSNLITLSSYREGGNKSYDDEVHCLKHLQKLTNQMRTWVKY